MARYFLHLRDGSEQVLDPDGVEFKNLDSLRKAVLDAARDIMCGDLRDGIIDLRFRIDAEDAHGTIVYTLPFKHAFSIIDEAPPTPGTTASRSP